MPSELRVRVKDLTAAGARSLRLTESINKPAETASHSNINGQQQPNDQFTSVSRHKCRKYTTNHAENLYDDFSFLFNQPIFSTITLVIIGPIKLSRLAGASLTDNTPSYCPTNSINAAK